MKGRKRKPYLLAKLDGDTGKRSVETGVVPAPGDFEPTFELGVVARAEWDRIRIEAPWISASSALLLSERCQAFEDLVTARRDIKKRGKLLKTKNGMVKNPSMQIVRDARQFIARVDPEFGLTSCSESKVHARPKEAIDALEADLCA